MARPVIDMTGWIMSEHGIPDSKITVIKRADDVIGNNGKHKTAWWCQCDCGSEPFVAVGEYIKNGGTQSCGCIRRKKSIARLKSMHKTNRYDLSGEYGIGWTTNTNEEFYFDLNDYEKIKDYCWREVDNHGVRGISAMVNGRDTTMHIVLGCKNYDHIDRNELNNRRDNLRPATVQQNAMNRSISKRNTSGFIGVSWSKISQKWIAQIKVNGVSIYLGSFVNKRDAIKTRLRAEVKYFGEFAPQKHLYEEYDIEPIQNN